MSSNRAAVLFCSLLLPVLVVSCGVSFRPAGEIGFDDSDVITAMNAIDLDSNGRADLVVGLSSFSGQEEGRTAPVFSTLFLFEDTGKTWKYLWKSYPLNRNDRRMETVADEVTAVTVSPDTNDRRLFIRTEGETRQLRFEKGHYLLEACLDPVDPPVMDRDLPEYFRFSFDAPFYFMKGDRQYLFLKRDDDFIEVYRFRPEKDPAFHRVGRTRTGAATAYCVFSDSSSGKTVLCVGRRDHQLSFFRVRGL